MTGVTSKKRLGAVTTSRQAKLRKIHRAISRFISRTEQLVKSVDPGAHFFLPPVAQRHSVPPPTDSSSAIATPLFKGT